jgi:hypothetical protein|nr:MAG TPA: hypothetical protein [Myoviridae sp. ctfuG5]
MSIQSFIPYIPPKAWDPKIREYDADQVSGLSIQRTLEICRHWLKGLQSTNTYTTDIHEAVRGIEQALLNLDRFERYRFQHYGILDFTINESLTPVYNGFSKYTRPLDIAVYVKRQAVEGGERIVGIEIGSIPNDNSRPGNVIPTLVTLFQYLYNMKPLVKEIGMNTNDILEYYFYVPNFLSDDVDRLAAKARELEDKMNELFKAHDRETAIVLTDLFVVDPTSEKTLTDPLEQYESIQVKYPKDRAIEAARDMASLVEKLASEGKYTISFEDKPGLLFVAGLDQSELDDLKTHLESKRDLASKLPPLGAQFAKTTKR